MSAEETKRLSREDAVSAADDVEDRVKQQRQKLVEKWVEQLPDWFPDLCIKTHFVPPIHVNKTKEKNLALSNTDPGSRQHCGLTHVTETKESDFRDDRAQLSVERVFWNLSGQRPEDVMVVLSKFSLDNYMNKTLLGACGEKRRSKKSKKAKVSNPKVKDFFPTPTDARLQRGDFDILIVHKEYGFIIIEIKAVGDQDDIDESLDDLLGKKEITEVLRQLNKRQLQLQIVTSDVLQEPQIPVTRLAAFPNVTRAKLQEVLKNPKYTSSSDLRHELQQYLGKDLDLDSALTFWLCQDEVSSADDAAMTWWKRLLEWIKPTGFSGIDDAIYKQLVARFCGPMSTVEVCRRGGVPCEARSVGDAVHEMGSCCKTWVLRQEQMEWRSSAEPYVYLTGPPGSGKTLLLLVKALEWVDQGDVVVVVRGPGNLPGHLISEVLHGQIVSTLSDERLAKRVQLETITAWTDPEVFLNAMKERARKEGGKPRLLVDELWLANPSSKFLGLVRQVLELIEATKKSVQSDCKSVTGVLSAAESDSTTLTEPVSPKTPSTKPGSTPSSYGETSEEEGDKSLKILEALNVAKETVDSLTVVHNIAKVTLTAEIQGELKKLSSAMEELQNALSGAAKQITVDDLPTPRKVAENVLDAQFFVEVLASWLASPVLHNVMQVARRHRDVGLWCTGFWANRRPDGYELGQLSTSIRCPSHVQDILDQTELLASHQDKKLYQYVTTSTGENPPLPAEAPPSAMLTWKNHGLHVQRGAELKSVSECQQCGQDLVSVLLDKLSVGRDNSKLQYRDVLIVARALLPIKPDSALVLALRAHRIPVSVVVRGSDDLQQGDLDSDDTVLVTNTYNGHGLERRVAVFIPDTKCCQLGISGDGGDGGVDAEEGAASGGAGDIDACMERLGEINRMGLWFIVSRSLAHVVIFHV